MTYVAQIEDRTYVIEVHDGKIIVDGQVHAVDLRRIEPLSLYSLLIDNLSHEVFVEERDGKYGAVFRGKVYTVEIQDKRVWEQNTSCPTPCIADGETCLTAPMPGLVLEVRVDVGQTKRAGEVLVVLESMKMRTELHCPKDGVVEAVHVAPHEYVTHGQVLVTVS